MNSWAATKRTSRVAPVLPFFRCGPHYTSAGNSARFKALVGALNMAKRLCGQFWRHLNEVVNGREKCTRCGKVNPLHVPASIRFWDHVDKSGDCWLWTGAVDYHGYGRVGFKGTSYPANRVAWIYTHGDPGKLYVCHKCDNTLCCRPDHMYLGTCKENLHDAARKQGWPMQKYGEKEYSQIREYRAAGMTMRAIAERVGVSQATASRAYRRSVNL